MLKPLKIDLLQIDADADKPWLSEARAANLPDKARAILKANYEKHRAKAVRKAGKPSNRH